MSLESKIKNQPFAFRRVVLASGWRQGMTSLFIGELARICVDDLTSLFDVFTKMTEREKTVTERTGLFWLLMLLALCYSCVSAGVSVGPAGQWYGLWHWSSLAALQWQQWQKEIRTMLKLVGGLEWWTDLLLTMVVDKFLFPEGFLKYFSCQ